MKEAWDDVNGKELKIEDVQKGRTEEVGFMVKRRIWDVVDVRERWEKTVRTGKCNMGGHGQEDWR